VFAAAENFGAAKFFASAAGVHIIDEARQAEACAPPHEVGHHGRLATRAPDD